MRHWRQLLLTGVVAGTLGCGGPSQPGPVSQAPPVRVNLDEIRPKVERFCGNCHQTPVPDSFPREQWPHEVERGYEFYLLSGRTDLKAPPRADVIAYYQQLAPERLKIPVADDPSRQPGRFQQQDWAWPQPSDDLVAIANVHVLPIAD